MTKSMLQKDKCKKDYQVREPGYNELLQLHRMLAWRGCIDEASCFNDQNKIFKTGNVKSNNQYKNFISKILRMILVVLG